MQLALPSRDYYLKADSEGDLKAYHRYMTEVAKLLGANASQAAEELQEVIRFERELANVSTGQNFSSVIKSVRSYATYVLLKLQSLQHRLILQFKPYHIYVQIRMASQAGSKHYKHEHYVNVDT